MEVHTTENRPVHAASALRSARVANPATLALQDVRDFSRLSEFFQSPRKLLAGLLLLVVKPVLILTALALWPFGCFYVWAFDLVNVCSKLLHDIKNEDGIGERIALFISFLVIVLLLVACFISSLPILLVVGGSLALQYFQRNPEAVIWFVVAVAGTAAIIAVIAVLVYVIWVVIITIVSIVIMFIIVGALLALLGGK